MIALRALAVLLAAALVQPALAQVAQRRVALTIGISDYRNLSSLPRAAGDATAVARQLEQLGFHVVNRTDLARDELQSTIARFLAEHREAEVAFIYYAGHGLQIDGRNYLVPKDARHAKADGSTLKATSVPLEQIFLQSSGVRHRIVVLDACRDDPRYRELAGDDSPATVPGLGRFGRADGTMYVFAAAPGRTAAEGTGERSPFTEALLNHLGKPDLHIASIMKLVQLEVYDRSGGTQLPYIEDALPALLFAQARPDALAEGGRMLNAMTRLGPDVREQVQRIATRKDVPLAPLYGALIGTEATLGSHDFAQRETLLDRAADEFLRRRGELKLLGGSDPEVAALRQEAEHQLSLGAVVTAQRALAQARGIDRKAREQLRENLKARSLSEAATLAQDASGKRSVGQYRAAAADLAEAAELAEPWDRSVAWSFTSERARDLHRQGEAFAERPALHEAVAILGKLLEGVGRATSPLLWADTQVRLAGVLLLLRELDGEVRGLQESIDTLHQALNEPEIVASPAASARIKAGLCRVANSTRRTDEGVERLRAALAVCGDAMDAMRGGDEEWGAMLRLGDALLALGKKQGDLALMRQALSHYMTAVDVGRRFGDRGTGYALGRTAMAAIAIADLNPDKGRELYDIAAKATRTALTSVRRDHYPMYWANLTSMLAYAMAQHGYVARDPRQLEEAAALYRSAMEESSRARDPVNWAHLQFRFGQTLGRLGRMQDAVLAYGDALAVFEQNGANDDAANVREQIEKMRPWLTRTRP